MTTSPTLHDHRQVNSGCSIVSKKNFSKGAAWRGSISSMPDVQPRLIHKASQEGADEPGQGLLVRMSTMGGTENAA